jgi:hypothetical protein
MVMRVVFAVAVAVVAYYLAQPLLQSQPVPGKRPAWVERARERERQRQRQRQTQTQREPVYACTLLPLQPTPTVNQDGVGIGVDTAPVRPAVALLGSCL